MLFVNSARGMQLAHVPFCVTFADQNSRVYPCCHLCSHAHIRCAHLAARRAVSVHPAILPADIAGVEAIGQRQSQPHLCALPGVVKWYEHDPCV